MRGAPPALRRADQVAQRLADAKRSFELTITRAAGISVWQLIQPTRSWRCFVACLSSGSITLSKTTTDNREQEVNKFKIKFIAFMIVASVAVPAISTSAFGDPFAPSHGGNSSQDSLSNTLGAPDFTASQEFYEKQIEQERERARMRSTNYIRKRRNLTENQKKIAICALIKQITSQEILL